MCMPHMCMVYGGILCFGMCVPFLGCVHSDRCGIEKTVDAVLVVFVSCQYSSTGHSIRARVI